MEDHKMKRAVIAGAARALAYRNKNFRATDQEVIKHITENAEEIVSNIEEAEEKL